MIKKYGIYALVFLLLIGAVFLIYTKLTPLKLPSNLVCASGSVDGDLIALNTKYAGRIDQIFVQDGQSIKKDDNVAILQSDEDEAQLRSLGDGIASAKASLEALIQNSAITKESVPLEIAKAQSALFVAIAQKKDLEDSLGTQKEQMEQDERDLARNSSLFDKSLISQQTYEYIKLKSQSSKNSYSSQSQRISQAQKKISILRTQTLHSQSLRVKKFLH